MDTESREGGGCLVLNGECRGGLLDTCDTVSEAQSGELKTRGGVGAAAA